MRGQGWTCRAVPQDEFYAQMEMRSCPEGTTVHIQMLRTQLMTDAWGSIVIVNVHTHTDS